MNTQHTRDKWCNRIYMGNPDVIVIYTTEEGVIAKIDVHVDRDKANAKLICEAVNNTVGAGINPKAVPELLEALQSLQSILCDPDGSPCFDGSDGDLIVARKAFKAIKKATL